LYQNDRINISGNVTLMHSCSVRVRASQNTFISLVTSISASSSSVSTFSVTSVVVASFSALLSVVTLSSRPSFTATSFSALTVGEVLLVALSESLTSVLGLSFFVTSFLTPSSTVEMTSLKLPTVFVSVAWTTATVETWGQFHQHFMSCFYAHRSHKRKNLNK